MSTDHGNWRKLSKKHAMDAVYQCHSETCVELATYVCDAHPFDGDWCGRAYCAEHLPAPGQQPGACSPACVHLMEAATLSARLVEAEEARDRALGLLNRWLSQHHEGGATDPCGVARELVAETLAAVRP